MKRTPAILLSMVGACVPTVALPAAPNSEDPYARVRPLLSVSQQEREAAGQGLVDRSDVSLVPGLVDAIFFTPKESRQEILTTLASLTGVRHADYHSWVEYVGEHPEIEPAPGYLAWKRSLLARIDSEYETVLYDGAPRRIRLEEIVWGGVPMAGIPTLDDPPTIAGPKARYLEPHEKVFGLVVAGEARAYPLRFLSWHELLNDTLGGEPITLSFCTLCGSGIFYQTRDPLGGAHRFDTSGLLYRSNKLMIDRRTRTLWSNLTGEPVVGPLAESPAKLEMLPGTLTTWEAWVRWHPGTTVLDLEGIEKRMRPRYRYEYRPGAAEQRRRDVSFPVWLTSDLLERERVVFTLRVADSAKAYPVDLLAQEQVVNDQVGGQPVVIVGDPESGSVRAYERATERFHGLLDGRLQDEQGGLWQMEEEGLRPVDPERADLLRKRLPGHLSYWFGWYAFFPETEVWRE